MSGDWQTIGRILKSNGTDGELLAGFPDGMPGQADNKEPVFIEFDGLPVPFFFESLLRRSGTRAVVRLTGVRSLKDALELEGKAIWSESRGDDDAEEDLTGWKVYAENGTLAGTVDGVEDIPGNTCLSIVTEGRNESVLIPFHEDLVISVDEKRQSLRMVIPEGLL